MVTLGAQLRALSRHKLGVTISVLLACLAALVSAYRLSVLPPALKARGQQTAGAHTQLLVDDRRVSVLHGGFDLQSFYDLHDGAVLAASIMVQDPVRQYIAQQAGLPVSSIQFTDPQVPIDPPLPQGPSSPRYSVTVAARPTVSLVDVYAQAPTSAQARKLADASVSSLSRYLAAPGNFGLRVTQLGNGADVTVGGTSWVAAAERFLAVLALGCSLTLMLSRARRSWAAAAKRGARLHRPAPRGVTR
jgi:hypothetical protein